MFDVQIKAKRLQQNALQQNQLILQICMPYYSRKNGCSFTVKFLHRLKWFGHFSRTLFTKSRLFFGVSSTFPAKYKQAKAIICKCKCFFYSFKYRLIFKIKNGSVNNKCQFIIIVLIFKELCFPNIYTK
jgi:hypothetical protein